MDALIQDVRFGLRSLLRQPGFTAIALITLAVGVGANTAIFTVVNAVVLRPLPFPDSERLVRVTADLSGIGSSDIGMSPPELFDYRDDADIFEGVAGLYPINANLTEVDEPERVEVMLVSPEYFSILEAAPALGRVFSTSEDNHPGIEEVVVISDALWNRRFARAPDVLGRTLRIDDDSFRIVGVMPPGFRHPGRTLRGEVDLWAPAGYRAEPFGPPSRRAYFLAGAIARLKPGLTVAQAQQRLDAFAAKLRATHPNEYPAAAQWTPRVIPLHEDLVGDVRPLLTVLLAAVGVVLLIACANIAGLVLARTTSRQRELAVRRALGSGRWRLVQMLLTESLLLSLAGGALGLLLAVWGVDLLLALTPDELPRLSEVRMSYEVIGFTLLISIATGVLFGIAPALQSSSPDAISPLKDARSASTGARQRARSVLIVAEFGLAMVLIVGAVLLARSFRAVQQVDPGFEADGVLTARVWLPRPNEQARGVYLSHPPRLALFERILSRLQQQPGVEKAAIVQNLPLDGQRGFAAVTIDGRESTTTEAIPTVQPNFASQDFFDVLRIPIVAGRAFTSEDSAAGAPVAVVNEEMAKRYFDGAAVGRRVRFGGRNSKAPWITVIGVVGDVLNDRLEGAPTPMLYRPMTQATNLSFAIVVRTSGDPVRLARPLTDAVQGEDPNVPTFAVRTMAAIQAAAMASRRFSMQLLGSFAILALLLATIGIYGVMSQLVTQRTREIGIRMALGATAPAVVRMIGARALVLAGGGVVVGTLAALVAGRVVAAKAADLLFQVQPGDPSAVLSVAFALMLTAVAAAAIPARRAARVDPAVALRAE